MRALVAAVVLAGCNQVLGLDPVGQRDPAGDDADTPDTPDPGDATDAPLDDTPDGSSDAPDARPPSGAADIVAGGTHTCVLINDGRVRCWGNASKGQLGYGNTNHIGDDEAPISAGDVMVGGAANRLTAGDQHTCAVLNNGAVRCWGNGSNGRLGYGSGNTTDIGDNEAPANAGNLQLGGLAIAIAAGGEHTCAITSDGVRCWGRGSSGALGYGLPANVGDDETPASISPIPGLETPSWIAAGAQHTCVVHRQPGRARCWGNNAFGQLGNGNTTTVGDNEVPTLDADVGGVVIQVVAGDLHTCALLDNGSVRCWGFAGNGRLGYGNGNNIGDGELPSEAGDVMIGGVVIGLAAGAAHTCALLEAGTVRCWGRNQAGQLGYGHEHDLGDDETPMVAGDVPVGAMATDLTAGGDHTCVRLATNEVKCWGSGTNGQLGYGNQNDLGDDETPAAAPTVAF